MSRPLKFILFLSIFLAGIAIGLSVGIFYSFERKSNADVDEVFLALTKISSEKILNNHCTDEVLSVGDFINSFIYWSFYHDVIFSYQTISCKGNGIQQCVWTYGKKGGDGYGWHTDLKFIYDQKTQSINSKSLLCERW